MPCGREKKRKKTEAEDPSATKRSRRHPRVQWTKHYRVVVHAPTRGNLRATSPSLSSANAVVRRQEQQQTPRPDVGSIPKSPTTHSTAARELVLPFLAVSFRCKRGCPPCQTPAHAPLDVVLRAAEPLIPLAFCICKCRAPQRAVVIGRGRVATMQPLRTERGEHAERRPPLHPLPPNNDDRVAVTFRDNREGGTRYSTDTLASVSCPNREQYPPPRWSHQRSSQAQAGGAMCHNPFDVFLQLLRSSRPILAYADFPFTRSPPPPSLENPFLLLPAREFPQSCLLPPTPSLLVFMGLACP